LLSPRNSDTQTLWRETLAAEKFGKFTEKQILAKENLVILLPLNKILSSIQ